MPGEQPVVAVVIPTRNRAGYLGVALRSIAEQRLDAPYEVMVADDGSDDHTAAMARSAGAGYVSLAGHRGTNAARNAGIRATKAPLVALVDDDVEAPPGWLDAVVAGARRHAEADAFAAPIRARLEGTAPRGCGREAPPITTLDLGGEDREADMAWSANMALRRSAFERVGPFDETLLGAGEEEDWIERLRADGGRVVYLAAAGLDHRREPGDARLGPLMRSAYRRGRAVRSWDRRRDTAPPLGAELRTLAGTAWHTLRRRCALGLVMGAHSAGRLAEAVRPGAAGHTPGP